MEPGTPQAQLFAIVGMIILGWIMQVIWVEVGKPIRKKKHGKDHGH